MANEVEIWNLALSHIGDRANVQATTEQSAQADACRRFYAMSRDEILAEHAWTFATKRVAMAELTLDLDSWDYKYTLPADQLKVLSVLPEETPDDHTSSPYLIENGAVYTNVENATMRYVYRQTTTGVFSPKFVIALSHLLASRVAGPIIKGQQGRAEREGQMKLYILALGLAKTADGNSDNTHRAYMPAGIMSRNAGIGAQLVPMTEAELRALALQ